MIKNNRNQRKPKDVLLSRIFAEDKETWSEVKLILAEKKEAFVEVKRLDAKLLKTMAVASKMNVEELLQYLNRKNAQRNNAFVVPLPLKTLHNIFMDVFNLGKIHVLHTHGIPKKKNDSLTCKCSRVDAYKKRDGNDDTLLVKLSDLQQQ